MLIYDKLVGDRVFWINFPHDGSLHFRVLGSPAIMRVNKQVNEEAQRAVKVRTLRMNKITMADVKLLSRIPKVVSHWVPTIDSVRMAYRHFEFEGMLGRSSEFRSDRLLAGLKQILGHLPNLVTATITCDDLPFNPDDQDLERQLSSFSKRLIAFLPQLNHIQIRTERKKEWATSSWDVEEVEIKLSKARPSIHPTNLSTAQNPVRYVQM